jgi:FPC/CPF motif-containing protein YcgG
MPAAGRERTLAEMPAKPGRPIRSSEVGTVGDWPDWFASAHAEFRATLLAEAGYPCHFGVTGERTDHNWFTALDQSRPGLGTAELAGTIEDFVPIARAGSPRQSLVVLVGPPQRQPDLARHAAQFWAVLRQLSRHDQQSWPVGRSLDPGLPDWQWCFAGQPWFVFGASPGYQHRHSRNVGRCLTMVFQLVDRVFEGLSGSSPAGQAAKRQIRGRLAGYDLASPHPHLGDAEHSSTYKWRQYFLPDDSRVLDEQDCPWTAPTGREPR